MRIDQETFVTVSDGDGTEFICPANTAGSTKNTSPQDMDDCVETDVAGRYAGLMQSRAR